MSRLKLKILPKITVSVRKQIESIEYTEMVILNLISFKPFEQSGQNFNFSK